MFIHPSVPEVVKVFKFFCSSEIFHEYRHTGWIEPFSCRLIRDKVQPNRYVARIEQPSDSSVVAKTISRCPPFVSGVIQGSNQPLLYVSNKTVQPLDQYSDSCVERHTTLEIVLDTV